MSELRFSDLGGREVVDTAGRRLGHVFDVHVEAHEGALRIRHLLVGRWGLLARLSIDVSWRLPGERVSWSRVVDHSPAQVVVRPEPTR